MCGVESVTGVVIASGLLKIRNYLMCDPPEKNGFNITGCEWGIIQYCCYLAVQAASIRTAVFIVLSSNT
jgi:hypothetical protein